MGLRDQYARLRRRLAAGRELGRGRGGEEAPPVAADAGTGAAPPGTCRYVAVIMDGNGRWAERRRLPVAAGHRAGVKALRRIIERALDHEIEELTVFSFSTENWQRPGEEVSALIELFVEMIRKETPELDKEGVRMRFLGRREKVPPILLDCIRESEEATAHNSRMTFYVAFNYGGRAELADAARAYAADVVAGRADAAAGSDTDADPELLRPYLYRPEMHDPELLIRTSGEMRISNFLLWQLAYTELYVTPTLWPDMGAADLDEALAEFATRKRRYGRR